MYGNWGNKYQDTRVTPALGPQAEMQSSQKPHAKHAVRGGPGHGHGDEHTHGCPARYEEIVGYCADSPIGNALSMDKFRCADQCNLNPDCLGFTWDKTANGKEKPFSCTLQHTECRFPIYSETYNFYRKKIVHHHHHKPPPFAPPPPPPPPPSPPVLPPLPKLDEPNPEVLRAFLSTYDQICDSDKQFKTTTVFTCAQYCLADASCQAFSYDTQSHFCRFIGHCSQQQVFKKRKSIPFPYTQSLASTL